MLANAMLQAEPLIAAGPAPRADDAAQPARATAQRRCREVLLNCFCREIAGPEGDMDVGPATWADDMPMSLRLAAMSCGGQVLRIALLHTGGRIMAVVSGASATGNHRYRSPMFHKASARPWVVLEGDALPTVLLDEMAHSSGDEPNLELLDQIRDSIGVTTLVLSRSASERIADDPTAAYVDSEQSLTFGHPFHPAPKSRIGFSPQDLRRYSPELGARFPLHYFSVRRDCVAQRSIGDESCVQRLAPHSPAVDPGHVAVPAHPWQAAVMLDHPLVRAAIERGRMRYLGPWGDDFFATSSIRTLFQPGNPYFYKFSLNIRITNCVRKNAWYELEGALQVSRIMRRIMPGLSQRFPSLRVLDEPAFLSINLAADDARRSIEVTEGFGLILRESIERQAPPGSVPLLAGALFGDHLFGERRIADLLAAASGSGAVREGMVERWFERYVAMLLHPVLSCYFAHGIIFEPHLQNTVLCLRDGWPQAVALRDFEGVKLVRERHPEAALAEVSGRARDALWYDAELGWQRIAYCLFVNNLCEAIDRLAGERPVLRRRLWAIVRHELQRYQAESGCSASARRINALLSGQAFPGKSNLINRLMKRPDRAATYHPVANPFAWLGEDAPWS